LGLKTENFIIFIFITKNFALQGREEVREFKLMRPILQKCSLCGEVSMKVEAAGAVSSVVCLVVPA